MIDEAISRIRKKHNAAAQEVKYLTGKKDELSAQLKQFEAIPTLEGMLTGVESTARHLSHRTESFSALYKALDRLDDKKRSQAALGAVLGHKKEVEAQTQLLHSYKTKLKEHSALNSLVDRIQSERSKLNSWTPFLAFGPRVAVLQDVRTKVRKAQERRQQLQRLLDQLDRAGRSKKEFAEQAKGYEKEFYELMPDNCPLCGQSVNKRRA